MKVNLLKAIQKLPRYCHDSCIISYYKLLSLFFKNKDKYREAWLICERGIEAKDNGYAFFKYMREKHPEQKVFYLIDPSQKDDYLRVQPLGNTIAYNSREHKMATFFASHFISTHIGFITPWSFLLYKTVFCRTQKPKFILLNHGITKEDMSQKLNKQTTGVDLFIAATRREWETIVHNKSYGYSETDVALTGYARYDYWHNFQTKRQIVFMPTWRHYLVERKTNSKNTPKVKSTFRNSSYYKHIYSFLNNSELHDLLKERQVKMIFYPHYEMQSSLHLFSTSCPNIIIAGKQSLNLPDILKESLAMVTDYSGVGFDFAYMYKPLVYYQFDQEEYYAKHYTKGEFDMEADGLGEIATTEEALMKILKRMFAENFQLEQKYKERTDHFFTFHDSNNCERIYRAILLYDKRKETKQNRCKTSPTDKKKSENCF